MNDQPHPKSRTDAARMLPTEVCEFHTPLINPFLVGPPVPVGDDGDDWKKPPRRKKGGEWMERK